MRGRKSLFREGMIQEGYKLGALGLTVEEIATIWNVNRTTLYSWAKKHPEFENTLKRGREEADVSVVQALLKECREKGNITGIIFWLKNRQPARWRDKTDLEANVTSIVYNIQKENKFLSERDKGLLNVNQRQHIDN